MFRKRSEYQSDILILRGSTICTSRQTLKCHSAASPCIVLSPHQKRALGNPRLFIHRFVLYNHGTFPTSSRRGYP
ncbi:hypothetical protein M405DRAFT_460775 [Rhizopogon salebrosus TDB-379]|nr:hypothetical protein M405DRAFT_460775 [Rhizopogon salebrosus TDB-379]